MVMRPYERLRRREFDPEQRTSLLRHALGPAALAELTSAAVFVFMLVVWFGIICG